MSTRIEDIESDIIHVTNPLFLFSTEGNNNYLKPSKKCIYQSDFEIIKLNYI